MTEREQPTFARRAAVEPALRKNRVDDDDPRIHEREHVRRGDGRKSSDAPHESEERRQQERLLPSGDQG